ncbi:HU family DNA-binding protein, partial [bacterium]|nr:HU family DNA-binding protein [bacterium]
MAQDKKKTVKVGKSEIAADFANEARISKKEASAYISTLLKVIVNRLKKGESVR